MKAESFKSLNTDIIYSLYWIETNKLKWPSNFCEAFSTLKIFLGRHRPLDSEQLCDKKLAFLATLWAALRSRPQGFMGHRSKPHQNQDNDVAFFANAKKLYWVQLKQS